MAGVNSLGHGQMGTEAAASISVGQTSFVDVLSMSMPED